MKINTKHGHLNIHIDTRRLDANFAEAQKALDLRIIRDTEPYVPQDTGFLRESAHYASNIGQGRIVYRAPYAHYLYHGRAMVGVESRSAWAKKDEPKEYNGKTLSYTKSGTGAEWFEKSKKRNLKSWISTVKKKLKG